MRDNVRVQTTRASVEVTVGGHPVLGVRSWLGRGEVLHLDLRPIGLDVHGDASRLHVGAMELARNTALDLDAMIAVG